LHGLGTFPQTSTEPSCSVLLVGDDADSVTCVLPAGSDSGNWVAFVVIAAVAGKVDPIAPPNADDHCRR
jgi:hypothetical protein